jgi:molybdopterin-guanine dinucleotide biosynthesis protein A
VLTALESSATPLVCVITLDMPNLTTPLVACLLDHLTPDAPGVMSRRALGGSPQIEPFPLLIRATAAELVRRRLDRGERAVHRLADEEGFVVLPADHWPRSAWLNLNTPADFDRFIAPPESS